MSDEYRKQAHDIVIKWYGTGKSYGDRTVISLVDAIAALARQAAADATKAERERHVPLLNAAEELCNLVDGYSGLGADAERAVERTRAAIRSVEPDAGDAAEGR